MPPMVSWRAHFVLREPMEDDHVAKPVPTCASSGAADPATNPAATSNSSTSSATRAAPFPVTVHAANGSVTIASRPTSIVSLSPTATEMLYAIGAGAQVRAVDKDSDYPR